jgi:hypothetical protein
LDGLGKLEQVSTLRIQANSLRSLDGLSPLATVIGEIDISDNAMLTSTAGLGSVIGASTVRITGNQSLSDITGLEAMSIDNELVIGSNHELRATLGEVAATNISGVTISGPFTDLEGLSHLESVDGIDITAPLTTLQGLRNLTTAGAITLTGMHVTSLEGLGKLALRQSDYLSLYSNAALRDLSGLGPQDIVGGLAFYSNPALVSLTGLEGLFAVANGLYLEDNASLASVSGIESLTSVNSFQIRSNASLASLAAFEALVRIGGELVVNDNPMLPTCAIRPLFDLTVASTVDIAGNAAPTSCP